VALSRDQGSGGGWPDRSDATRLRIQNRIDGVAASLHAVHAKELTSPEDRLLYDNLLETVDASIGSRSCRFHLWATTNQFSGWHVAASNTARVQPVGNESARAGALTLFGELPSLIRAEQELLERGLDSSMTIAAPVVASVLRQLDDLLPAEIEKSPLYQPAARDSDSAFRERWRALLVDTVYPAGQAFRTFLAERYMPRARPEGSLATMPGGTTCYAASLRAQTSLNASPDSVMRDARREADRLRTAAAPLVRRLTGEDDLATGIRALRSGPQFTFPNRDSVLAAYRVMNQRAAAAFGRVVANLKAESLAVVPYPEFQERANLPPQYIRANDDGSRPAQFMVNLARTERMAVANAAAHEGYPGHHLQRIAAVRAPAVHPVMRLIGVSGFSEGWGIYSEEIAKDMGMYTTALDSAGVLVHLLDVALGNYLDIGYHTRGWTREQIVDSMMVVGGRPRAQAEAYADRHAATPGQLATYFIGYRAIGAARQEAERVLGSRFRMPEFHYQVIRDGSITLASMTAKIGRWIEQERKAKP
jgi:uncharacterized protein (DUF885 family)